MNTFPQSSWWVIGSLVCACAGGNAAATAPKPAPVRAVEVAPAEPCVPAKAAAGQVPSLPTVELQKQPVQVGEEYTVWGLGYSLRSRQHRELVTRQPITVTGYIVASNLASAPPCLVHRGGIADAEDCYGPVPAFWLGDRPDSALTECVKVMGFASNYAQIYDAIHAFDRGEPTFSDMFWGQEIPNPLPAVGAKVRVTGKFGTTFSMASSGMESDATMGILTFRSMQTLEPARELATLPGVTRKVKP